MFPASEFGFPVIRMACESAYIGTIVARQRGKKSAKILKCVVLRTGTTVKSRDFKLLASFFELNRKCFNKHYKTASYSVHLEVGVCSCLKKSA
jgi:hypothetical protein